MPVHSDFSPESSKEDNTVVEKFNFTVFRVELEAFTATTQTSAAEIPDAALDTAGNGPRKLRDLYDSGKPDRKFGYSLAGGNNRGGIYLSFRTIL
jgi:hypothetical protein